MVTRREIASIVDPLRGRLGCARGRGGLTRFYAPCEDIRYLRAGFMIHVL